VPAASNTAVVESVEESENVTEPGPLAFPQAYVGDEPEGSPSSVAAPFKLKG
jgi:hypothetical protein